MIDQLRKHGFAVDPMEDWTADPREPKVFSQERVEGCDLCVLLVGFRRGYVPDGETRSITQLEFDAAETLGVDVLVFMLDEGATWDRLDERDSDLELVRWRAHLKKSIGVGFFGADPDSIDIGPALTRWERSKKGVLSNQDLIDFLKAHVATRLGSGDGSDEGDESWAGVSSTAGFVGRARRGPTSPVRIGSLEEYNSVFGSELHPDESYLGVAVRGFFENGGRDAYVVRVLGSGARAAAVEIPVPGSETPLRIEARSAGRCGNDLRIETRRGTRRGLRITIDHRPVDGQWNRHTPEAGGSPVEHEDFDNLPSLHGFDIYRSELVVLEPRCAIEVGRIPIGSWQFQGGSDGEPLQLRDYIGEQQRDRAGTGLVSLARIDDVDLVCVPDHVHPMLSEQDRSDLTALIVGQCEHLRDRFAILGTNQADGPSDDIPAPVDTRHAAMFWPWLRDRTSDLNVPPIGHVAGLFCQADRESGMHVLPTGKPIEGLDSEHPLAVEVSDADEDRLMRLGISTVGRGPGSDAVITVAQTMAESHGALAKSITGQRTAMMINQAIGDGTQWAVEQPNDPKTWSEVETVIGEFLEALWKQGALSGETAEEAFYVKCDAETNPPEEVDLGKLTAEVGFALPDMDRVHRY